MSQRLTHQLLLEQLSGFRHADHQSKQRLKAGWWLACVIAVTIAVSAIAQDTGRSAILNLGLGVLIAGMPFTYWVSVFILRLGLERSNLRVSRLVIGKKTYLNSGNKLSDLDLGPFATVAHLLSEDDVVELSAWSILWESHVIAHDHKTASSVGLLTHSKQKYTFVYGDTLDVLERADELWELGHVRKLTPADKTQFLQTADTRSTQHGIAVCLAYKSGADHDTSSGLTVLGVVELDSHQRGTQPFVVIPTKTLSLSALLSLYSLGIVILISMINIVGLLAFNVPIGLSLTNIVTICWLVPLLPAIAIVWDTSQHQAIDYDFRDIAWTGILISAITFGSYVVYLGAHNVLGINEAAKDVLQGASAVALLSLGLCSVVNIMRVRSGGSILGKQLLHKPLFIVSILGALLVLASAAYAVGSVWLTDALLILAGPTLFFSIREVENYANTHHTREHIFKLLK